MKISGITASHIRRLKAIVILSFLTFVLLAGIYFVHRYNKYTNVIESKADSPSQVCTSRGASATTIKESEHGFCDYGYSGGNRNIIGDEAGGTRCGPADCVLLDTRPSSGDRLPNAQPGSNYCSYTHFDVCLQKKTAVGGSLTGSKACSFVCGFNCCYNATERYVEVGGGKVISEKALYGHPDFNGRLQVASCENGALRLNGWAGYQDDWMAQVDVFFTIGKSYEEGGLIYNPNYKVNLPDPDGRGSLICDFIDGKPNGPVLDCEKCVGTACNHMFNITLENIGDKASPIFTATNGVPIYAYVSYNGKYGPITDAATDKVHFIPMVGDCTSLGTAKKTSDAVPESVTKALPTPTPSNGLKTPTPTVTPSGAEECDPEVEGECQPVGDFNWDWKVDFEDFTGYFVGYYRGCQLNDNTSDCESGDLTDDEITNFDDFVEFVKSYNEFYEESKDS